MNRLKSMYEIAQSDEATLDDLLDLIRIKVAAMQRQRDEARKAEQQFVGYILNMYHQVAQRLRTAEALLQAFVEYAQTLSNQDPTLNRLVTEATHLLREGCGVSSARALSARWNTRQRLWRH
jgi:tRNA U34 5-carboxymethylaminomethyl modifying enzyme MnmG/GidA